MTNDLSDIRLRRGKFAVKAEWLHRRSPFIQKIMSQMIVTRCEYLWSLQVFDYEAISPLFDLCPENQKSPDYQFFEDEFNDLGCRKVEDRLNWLKVND
jgi:hypothetical protein